MYSTVQYRCTVQVTVQVWYMRDCGLLICIQLMCPIKVLPPASSLQCDVHLILFQSVQAWQAEGVPVAAVDKTEDSVELNKSKEKQDEN